MKQDKIYFPNLNGLRFLAAFLVIVHHIEQIKSIHNLHNYWKASPFIELVGTLGVVLFFVLSGFLITYLLLAEEKSAGTINVGHFYIRRMLRIWPLYFFIIICALFVLPNISFFTLPNYSKEVIHEGLLLKCLLFFTFFANLVMAFWGLLPYASQTWSVGTEEQYYLVWPVVLKYARNYRLAIIFTVIIVYSLVKVFLSSPYSHIVPFKNVLAAFWSGFSIDHMCIGAVFAVLLFQKRKILNLFLNNYIFYVTLAAVIPLIALGVSVPGLHYKFYSLCFGILILNFAANDKIGISLENRAFNYLGTISYGLYMYHFTAIVIAVRLAMYFGYTSNLLIYLLSISLTVILAAVSYKYMEAYFLKLKVQFSKVISGDNAKTVTPILPSPGEIGTVSPGLQ